MDRHSSRGNVYYRGFFFLEGEELSYRSRYYNKKENYVLYTRCRHGALLDSRSMGCGVESHLSRTALCL